MLFKFVAVLKSLNSFQPKKKKNQYKSKALIFLQFILKMSNHHCSHFFNQDKDNWWASILLLPIMPRRKNKNSLKLKRDLVESKIN